MKRISLLLVTLALWTAPGLRGQDAATEERLNKLAGQIDNLVEGQQALKRQIEALAKELDNLRAEAGKPKGDYASAEDLKRVADAVKEVDRKRIEDSERIQTELKKLGKTLATAPAPVKKAPPTSTSDPGDTTKSSKSDTGFEYIVKSGDSLSAIVKAYHDKHINVSMNDILKANPNLVPEKMKVDQKIWIPAPQ
jgi:LysM repeat protein